VEGDRLTLSEPLTLPLLGGDLVLDDVALVDLLRPTRHLATSVELHALSLAQLSRLLTLPPLEGELGGAFPTVRLTPTTLRVDGTGLLTLFGGTASVSNISGRTCSGATLACCSTPGSRGRPGTASPAPSTSAR